MEGLVIVTDGACRRNPGPGGWASLVMETDRATLLWGSHPETTNNRMEMTALIEGLTRAVLISEGPRPVEIVTDSAYLSNPFTKGWLGVWERRGWKTADKKPVKNQDLWAILGELVDVFDVSWTLVKGHAGHALNELVDRQAVEASHNMLSGEAAVTGVKNPS